MKFTISSVEELDEVAKKIASLHPQYDKFIFDAPMGAGKTTLISKICNEFEIEENCSSPTYSIYNEYYSSKVGSIYHFDCYRLKNLEEALDAGLEEILNSTAICLIEWPEIIKKLLPENFVEVSIEHENNNRTISIHYDT